MDDEGIPSGDAGQETRVNVSREDPWDSRDPAVTDEQGTFLSAIMGKHLKPQSGDVLQETMAQSAHTGEVRIPSQQEAQRGRNDRVPRGILMGTWDREKPSGETEEIRGNMDFGY